jgi:hypothetical protein
MAVRRDFEVGILMSTDTDMKPALEAVAQLTATQGTRAEVAAWSTWSALLQALYPLPQSVLPLAGKDVYDQITDPIDYSIRMPQACWAARLAHTPAGDVQAAAARTLRAAASGLVCLRTWPAPAPVLAEHRLAAPVLLGVDLAARVPLGQHGLGRAGRVRGWA